MKYNKFIVILIAIAAIAALGFSTGYLFNKRDDSATVQNSSSSSVNSNTARETQSPASAEIPFFPAVLSTELSDTHLTATERILNIFARLLLAVILSAILAFRPRRNQHLFKRNINVAQTQILLAVVAAALMIIVGDNTARAFAIFAAVSLVRFRTNIKDPKEITVLLISLALGLATGVGRWELGVFLCFFVLGLLWLLEFNEAEQIYRVMELTVKTRDTDKTQNTVKAIFKKDRISAEVHQLAPPDDEEPVGCIVYNLNMRLSVSTDRLSEQILASNSGIVESIQWKQQKDKM